jgi:predicted AlkP superfamily pyrophosphatase or phosphodiesterase
MHPLSSSLAVPGTATLRRACVAATLVAFAIAGVEPTSFADGTAAPAPRLVLQITVDQLRADLPLRCRDRWGEGGFRRLYDEGVVFSDAHFGHANTETVVGHATLATGADPSVHGMVGNAWYDRESRAMHQNVDDPRYAAAGNLTGSGASLPADAGHGAAAKKSAGRSPAAMLAPALADSFTLAGGGRAKVFSVSMKDRAAVPMGGRSGKSLWWSDTSGEFVSSTYYYPDSRLPEWARAWNRRREAVRMSGRTWTLLLPPSTYRYAAADDMPWEEPPEGMTRTFPHRYDRGALKDGFFSALVASPFGDELVAGFVRALLQGEEVGRDDVVDYVSVSLSSTDYIGHRFGPDSLETEDQMLRVDRVIAQLMKAADDAAGPGRTLFVLSADHGVAEPVDEQKAEGHDSGRIVLSSLLAGEPVRALEKRFGGPLVTQTWPPYVYLDDGALRRRGVDPVQVQRALAAEIAKAPGVAAVFTRDQIEHDRLPRTDVARAVRRGFHPGRSGDLHVVAKPRWQIAYEGPKVAPYATGHGTPWDYDSAVPLVLAGAGLPAKVVSRRVGVADAAPTVAALAGVPAPARATGKPLPEAVVSRR